MPVQTNLPIYPLHETQTVWVLAYYPSLVPFVAIYDVEPCIPAFYDADDAAKFRDCMLDKYKLEPTGMVMLQKTLREVFNTIRTFDAWHNGVRPVGIRFPIDEGEDCPGGLIQA